MLFTEIFDIHPAALCNDQQKIYNTLFFVPFWIYSLLLVGIIRGK